MPLARDDIYVHRYVAEKIDRMNFARRWGKAR
jgi:hypothetical protein